MVREHGGDGEIVVPPTIHALLQARIDSLDGDVRVVMERGSVEGEVFHRGAVAQLSPGLVRADVESHLTTLVRKELIRSTAPTFPEDEGYRFRHLLIRDAAYESLPKATRAELHEQFADWLSTHDLVERTRSSATTSSRRIATGRSSIRRRPGARPSSPAGRRDHLRGSGRGALDRGDYNAGRSLLRRAIALLPSGDEARLCAGAGLSPSLFGSRASSTRLWTSLAEARGSRRSRHTRARDDHRHMTTWADGRRHTHADERSVELARRGARVSSRRSDHDDGLGLYWWSLAGESWLRCRAAEAPDRVRARARASRALRDRFGRTRRLRLAGSVRIRVRACTRRRGDRACRGARRGGGQLGLARRPGSATSLGRLYAMKGEIDRGRELYTGRARRTSPRV